MHECPDCSMVCDCDGEDIWHDWPFNQDCTHACEEDDDDDLYLDDDYEACVECGSPNVTDQCKCCGGYLCHMHSEIGCGFCKNCPTEEWIAEQERDLARQENER